MKRVFKPRAAIVVAPAAITTDNCFAVAGVSARKLREAVARHRDIPHARMGQTLVLHIDHFYALLERLRVDANAAIDTDEPSGPSTLDDEPQSVGQILARVGLRSVATNRGGERDSERDRLAPAPKVRR